MVITGRRRRRCLLFSVWPLSPHVIGSWGWTDVLCFFLFFFFIFRSAPESISLNYTGRQPSLLIEPTTIVIFLIYSSTAGDGFPGKSAGQRIYLLGTRGEEGVAALGDEVPAGDPRAHILGWVIFSQVIEYCNEATWAADVAKHCVPPGTPYSWSGATAC